MSEPKKEITRRGFISTAASLAASAGMMSLGPAAAMAQTKEETTTQGEIIYRTLGRTGMKIPIVSMGVMNANNPEVVRASYENGVRHFDTAAAYQYGRNEEMVGKVIGQLKVRDKVNIATKIFTPSDRDRQKGKARKDAMFAAFDESLKRLNMDYVDILYIHSVTDNDFDSYNDPYLLEGLSELKQQGKIKAHGVSTHRGMTGVINNVAEKKFYDVILTAINISLASYTTLLDAIEKAAKQGIGIIAMKTQAGGSRMQNAEIMAKYDSPTINKASLKWVLQNENITTAIPGYDNFNHMNENLTVNSNLTLSAREKAFLDENEIEYGFDFCEQCDKCLATCPHDTDIPTLMRTHMYATRYGNPVHARMTLNEMPSDRHLNLCGSCSSCVASCANKLDIPQKISDLKQIFA